MGKKRVVVCTLALFIAAVLAGCYQPGGPVPEAPHPPVARDYTQEQVDAAVVMEERVIHSSEIPDACGAPDVSDEIHFLRFRPSDGSTLDLTTNPPGVNPKTTDAMLVMLPGILEGANGFEYIGRNLVYMAKTQNSKNIEVWAVERRNNRIEDLSAANYLEEQVASRAMTLDQAAQVAIDYYYNKKPLNGKTFDGWYRDKDVPFLSEFGLKLDTEDVYTVINTMVPDRATRKQKVFVGGHSLGGIMTSMFAAWDLDGDPNTLEDAGFNNCAGIFGLDTIVTPINEIVDLYAGILPKPLYDELSNMTDATYAQFLDGIRAGLVPVILPFPLITAESMGLLEALSIAADFAPDEECTLIHKVPYSSEVQTLLGFLHSYDLQTFLTNKPEVRDFRYTNEALLGAVFDDSFTPVGMIQNSMGFLAGGPVVKKKFPAYDILYAIPGVSQIVSNIMGKGPYYIPNDAGPITNLRTGPLYSWVNFDEVGDAADPDFKDTAGQVTYTTTTNEVTDIQDVARALYKGPTNLTEWYFSMRLMGDLVAASMPFGPKYGLNVFHANRVKDLPKVEFVAEQGVLNDTIMSVLVPYKYNLIKGYNHLDVLMASANTSSRRPNEVIRPLINFVLQNI